MTARWTITALAIPVITMTACTSTVSGRSSPSPPAGRSNKAADLEARLDFLLEEHLMLVAKATGAIARARAAESEAYISLTRQNTADLSALIGTASDGATQVQLDATWAAHDVALIDYARAVVARDGGGKQRAVQELTGSFVPQFGALLAPAAGLPAETVAGLARTYVKAAMTVIDRQGGGDLTGAYGGIRLASAAMLSMGDTLAQALATRRRARFPGDARGAAALFRCRLETLLQEHQYLVTSAAAAALGRRPVELNAVAEALRGNDTDTGGALGGISDESTGNRWGQIRSSEEGSLVAYASAGPGAAATKQEALSRLTGELVSELSELVAGLTGMTAKDAVALLREQVQATVTVIDGQAARRNPDAAGLDRAAGRLTMTVGDTLAAAIAAKSPDRFRG